jgi:FdhE protein
LSAAADMQIALVDLQRRIQSRVATPLLALDESATRARLSSGKRLVEFEDMPLDWAEFRLTFRQAAEILRRFDALDQQDHDTLQTLVREGARIEVLTRSYYARTARPGSEPEPGTPAMLDAVLALALRPFLARCAEVCLPRADLTAWYRAWCPVCGGEPDFATLSTAGDRLLICGRCIARWPFDQTACPFCGAQGDDVTSFASRDGRYRVYGCGSCRRYLKAYDGRGAARPVMPMVDTIATLPLDAAAIKKGYDR